MSIQRQVPPFIGFPAHPEFKKPAGSMLPAGSMYGTQ